MAYIIKKGKDALLDNLRGKVGNIVFKQYGNRIVISRAPDMSRVKRTKKQIATGNKFQDAVTYAKEIITDPKKKKAFAKKIKKGQSVYQAAISAYMKGGVAKSKEIVNGR